MKNELADCFTYRTAHGFVNRNPIGRKPKRALPGADRFISDLTRPTDSVAMECPDEGVVHFVHGRLQVSNLREAPGCGWQEYANLGLEGVYLEYKITNTSHGIKVFRRIIDRRWQVRNANQPGSSARTVLIVQPYMDDGEIRKVKLALKKTGRMMVKQEAHA